jgi:hypothetical protein
MAVRKVVDSKVNANMGALSLLSGNELTIDIYNNFKKSSKLNRGKNVVKQVNKMKKAYNDKMGSNLSGEKTVINNLEKLFLEEFGPKWFNNAVNAVSTLRRDDVIETAKNTGTRIEKLKTLITLAEKMKNPDYFLDSSGDMDNTILRMKEWLDELERGAAEFQSGSRKSSKDGTLLKARIELLNKYTGFILGEALDSAVIETLIDKTIGESVRIVGNETEATYRVTKTGKKKVAGYKNQVGDILVTTKVKGEEVSFLISDKMIGLSQAYKAHGSYNPEAAIQNNVKIARILAIIKGKGYKKRFANYMSASFNYNRYRKNSLIYKSYAGRRLNSHDAYLKALANMIWIIVFEDAFGLGNSSKKLVSAMIISKKFYTIDDLIPKDLMTIRNQSNETVFERGSSLSQVPYTEDNTYYKSDADRYLLKYLDLKTTVKIKTTFLNYK